MFLSCLTAFTLKYNSIKSTNKIPVHIAKYAIVVALKPYLSMACTHGQKMYNGYPFSAHEFKCPVHPLSCTHGLWMTPYTMNDNKIQQIVYSGNPRLSNFS